MDDTFNGKELEPLVICWFLSASWLVNGPSNKMGNGPSHIITLLIYLLLLSLSYHKIRPKVQIIIIIRERSGYMILFHLSRFSFFLCLAASSPYLLVPRSHSPRSLHPSGPPYVGPFGLRTGRTVVSDVRRGENEGQNSRPKVGLCLALILPTVLSSLHLRSVRSER